MNIADVAALAWNETKAAEDPVFKDCIIDHRLKLQSHAESVQRAGVPVENPSDFEKRVAELLAEPEKTEKAIAKAKADEARAAADAMHAKADELAAAAGASSKSAKKEK